MLMRGARRSELKLKRFEIVNALLVELELLMQVQTLFVSGLFF